MNRELMMKVAIQFKGAWPDEGDTHMWLNSGGMVSGNINEDVILDEDDIICTRKKFESFVESLFEGAPEGTTHIGSNGLFYKVGPNSAHYMTSYNEWAGSLNKRDWLSNNLIPRPAKKAELEPYTPKPLKYCELLMTSGNWHRVFVTFVGRQHVVFMLDGDERIEYTDFKRFRPIITERQQRAIDLYRMFHNDGLQAREIMQSDEFDAYLNIWDTLVKFKRGDV